MSVGLPELPDEVLYEVDGAVRIVTLNRPDKLNAANLSMQQGLVDCWAHVADDDDARVVVLTGAGRAFSAGGDMSVLEGVASDAGDLRTRISRITTDIMRGVLECPRPVIAAVNGLAMGFGAGLVALCDLVVMAEDAYLADPHARLGMPASPGCELVWPALTSRVVAKELLMFGTRVGAENARRLGLANAVVPAGEALTAALTMAAALAEEPAAGITEIKRAMNRDLLATLATRDSAGSHRSMETAESQAAIADLLDTMRR